MVGKMRTLLSTNSMRLTNLLRNKKADSVRFEEFAPREARGKVTKEDSCFDQYF